MIYYEEEINYKPILKTAKELLKKRGYIDCCSILDEGTISVVCTDYDNWNGGTYGYTIYVSLPVPNIVLTHLIKSMSLNLRFQKLSTR